MGEKMGNENLSKTLEQDLDGLSDDEFLDILLSAILKDEGFPEVPEGFSIVVVDTLDGVGRATVVTDCVENAKNLYANSLANGRSAYAHVVHPDDVEVELSALVDTKLNGELLIDARHHSEGTTDRTTPVIL